MSLRCRLRSGGILLLLMLALLYGVLALLLDSAEAIPDPPPPARVAAYGPNPYIVCRRPYLYFHIPGARYVQVLTTNGVEYAINSLGFRGPEVGSKTLKRLLVVGDSQVEGHGVEFDRAFPARMNSNLRVHGWEVVNAGVQGASPVYYAANLPRYLALQPDTVLLAVFLNDWHEDRIRERTIRFLRHIPDKRTLLYDPTGTRTMSLWSRYGPARFLRYFRSAYVRRRALDNARLSPPGAEKTLEEMRQYLGKPELLKTQIAMSEPYFSYFLDRLRDKGIAVRVVGMFWCLDERVAHEDYLHAVSILNAHLRKTCTNRGIPYTAFGDMDPEFNDRWLLKPDLHLSPEGHRVLADRLGDWLLRPAVPPEGQDAR